MLHLKRTLLTVSVAAIAFLLQGLFVGTSYHILYCKGWADFSPYLRSTCWTLVPEYLVLALGLFGALKWGLNSSTKVASAYMGAFTVGWLLSFLGFAYNYYQANGC
ncbi:hypothetical protein [Hymenobacter terrestris]|uniref:MARVEL domain-containing protein n=1 Tax=Hymenobacter terrestris TaxID=2748310 RepID=A0ABX2Q736_9BACT|nr:hypothetical protein [Hymenobacter terrestris]NVO86794.1 hypothetical protein [Hymenobacter terrestris]